MLRSHRIGQLALRLMLAALLLLPAIAPFCASAQTTLRIAALVNDDVITYQDLLDRLALVVAASRLPDNAETRQRLAPQVLRSYIDETLELQEAERLGIEVSDGELRAAFATVAARNGLKPSELARYLRDRGIPVSTLERQLRAQLAWAKVIERRIKPRVVVSREQIELALQTEAPEQEVEVRLFEILLPVYRPADEPRVLAQARELVAALRDGADFEALAHQVSAAASAEAGGDLGWVPLSGLVETIRRVVASLDPGEVSDPVRTERGVRILMVRDRRLSAAADGADDIFELAQLVIPFPPDADPGTVERARLRAEKFRAALDGCAAIERTARELRAPASGRLGWMTAADLPPRFARVVAGLAPGEVSAPLRGPTGFHILAVCARGGEEGKRELVRLRLQRQQIERLAAQYLRELRKSAYIDVRL